MTTPLTELLNRSAPVLLLTAMLGCSSPYQTNGASCPAAVCSNHGTCEYESTYPTCTCANGYTGQVCSACNTGYHRASDDSCVADAVCMPGMCANGGLCSVVAGVATCGCLPGYGGMLCATCVAGFHMAASDGGMSCTPDQTCLESSCSGAGTCALAGGVVTCTCNAGHGGTYCGTPSATCAMSNPCTANGTCSDYGGVVTCNCAAGSGGPTCATCYAGYEATDGGNCQIAPACSPSSCSFAGTCSITAGTVSCACSAGYIGGICDSCDVGYHHGAGYACVADETCTATQCGANGTCIVSGGVAGCTCNAGWAGLACDTCYPGYHLDSGDGGMTCDLDTDCDPTTCRTNGTCSQTDAGGVSCACNPGFTGNFCETSLDSCANNACGAGQCINQSQGYVCLCPADGGPGLWGNSCP